MIKTLKSGSGGGFRSDALCGQIHVSPSDETAASYVMSQVLTVKGYEQKVCIRYVICAVQGCVHNQLVHLYLFYVTGHQ